MYLSLQVCGFSHGFHAVRRLSVLSTPGTQVGPSKACHLTLRACVFVCIFFFVEAMLFDMFQLCVDLWVCVYTSVWVCVCMCVRVAEQSFSACLLREKPGTVDSSSAPCHAREQLSVWAKSNCRSDVSRAERSLKCVCVYVICISAMAPICVSVFMSLQLNWLHGCRVETLPHLHLLLSSET